MRPAARAGARALLVLGLAAATSFALRGALFSAVGRHVDAAVDAFADVAHRLPSPRAVDPPSEAPPPPPPAVVASAIASTQPTSSFHAVKSAPSAMATKMAPKTAAGVQTVTRAEVEDAIATKCHGVRASLVRDDTGAPIGLALHRVGALARFGVSEGDVLVAANGQPLRTPDEALAALGALKDATRVAVALRRGDSTYVVTLQIAGADDAAEE